VLFFALAVAAVATLASGLFPAWQSARADLAAGTNVGGRSGTGGPRQTRMRSSLVVAEVALSIVLLLGAGLLMRTFVKLVGVDLGFDPRNILITDVAFPPGETAAVAGQRLFYRQALDRIAAIPGVRSVAVASAAPPFGGRPTALEIPGVAVSQQASALVVFCSERLLDTIGVSLVAGRPLSVADMERSDRVAVVNDTFARRYFVSGGSIGRTIRLPTLATVPVRVTDPTFVVIGVVRDMANQGLREPPFPQVFVPFTLRPASRWTDSTMTVTPSGWVTRRSRWCSPAT